MIHLTLVWVCTAVGTFCIGYISLKSRRKFLLEIRDGGLDKVNVCDFGMKLFMAFKSWGFSCHKMDEKGRMRCANYAICDSPTQRV